MKLELKQTLRQEISGEGEVEMKQTMTPQQWYAMQMGQVYTLRREMRGLRLEESERYMKTLKSIDPGIGHFIHSVIG
jgi:hypothetical protein